MKRYNNDCILVFSDTHAPYNHPASLSFLEKVRDTYQPDRVICNGDLGDIYSVSNYPTDVNHPDTWHQEIKGLRRFVTNLVTLFPFMDVLTSNHDDRIYRKAVASGVPRETIVPYKDIIGTPDPWKWHDRLSITVDYDRSNWTFVHTISTASALHAAKFLGCNVCMGHFHSRFGASAWSPNGKKIIYGVDTGCLISDKGSPFKYNKGDIGRPIRGCVVIKQGVPFLIPMEV